MPTEKRKILLVENSAKPFIRISDTIAEKLGAWVEVYPKIDGTQRTIENFDHFVEKYVEMENFKAIVDHYKDVDLFIVDLMLKEGGEGKTNGFEFEKHVEKTCGKPVLTMSTRSYPNKKWYVWKGPDYPDRIVDQILIIFPDLWTLIRQPDPEPPPPAIAGIIVTSGRSPATASFRQKVKDNILLHGYLGTSYKGIEWIGNRWKVLVHMCITSVFYFLLIITTIYAAKVTYLEFFPGKPVPGTPPPDKEHLKDMDVVVLEHAEHIFLYLLPIFITFGFFIYYKNNIKISFFGGSTQDSVLENSTKSMTLTKAIFISSIISYTLIRLIDQIFFKENKSIVPLVSAGILLAMLMAYFILISKSDPKGH